MDFFFYMHTCTFGHDVHVHTDKDGVKNIKVKRVKTTGR